MDDNTTTDAPVDTGADEALPEQQEEASAGTGDSDQSADERSQGEDSEEDSQPDVDDKLKKYAESKGLELDSPNAIKAAKMAMESQAEYTRTRQKASKLEKSMVEQSDQYSEQVAAQTGQDPELLKRLNRMEVREAKRDFYDRYPEAREHESDIAKTMLEMQIYGSPDAVLDAAWAKVQASNPDSLKSEGAKTALNNLASKQRAAAPTGSAVSSAPTGGNITRAEMQRHLAAGDTAWFEKNRGNIDRLVAEGRLQ